MSLQDVYVLHTRAYRETSLLVDLFSRQSGRVSAIAKGARSGKSPLRNSLQPFTQLELALRGQRELKLITAIESVEVKQELKGKALYSAFYLNEILLRLTQVEDPYPGLYNSYSRTLDHLRNSDTYDEFALRIFERDLLNELGFGLQLDYEIYSDRPIDVNRNYHYLMEEGPRPALPGQPAEGVLVSGMTLQALSRGAVVPDRSIYQEAKRLMRAVLRLYLGEKPLKSRKLFE